MGGIFYELVGEVVRFPVWWYSTGILHTIGLLFGVWRGYARTLAIGVWMKNLFVPMYGQYSIQGRIISVFMRLVQIVFRGLALVLCGALLVVLFGLYVAMPVISSAFLFYHLTGGIFGLYE